MEDDGHRGTTGRDRQRMEMPTSEMEAKIRHAVAMERIAACFERVLDIIEKGIVDRDAGK